MVFLFGPCLTAIAETFDIPVGRTGLLFTFHSIGLIPAVLLVAFLSGVIGRRRLLLLSAAAAGGGCILFAASPGVGRAPVFAAALATTMIIGVGAGWLEVLLNALLADDNRPSPAFAINLGHVFFAIGAVAGPLVAGLLLGAGLPWEFGFYGVAALFLLLFLTLLSQPEPVIPIGPTGLTSARTVLKHPMLWLMLLVLALYVGAEVGFTAWVSPLMEEVLGANRGSAALSVSVFWVFMIVGRVATSALSLRYLPRPLILSLAFGSTTAMAGAAYAPGVGACLALSGLAGLFMSGVFGMVATDASRHFPDSMSTVFSFLMAGVGAGGLLVPAAMGWIATLVGLRVAMLLPPTLMVAVLGAYLVPWSNGNSLAAHSHTSSCASPCDKKPANGKKLLGNGGEERGDEAGRLHG
ncbi:MAG: MFS transporter [Armatimonadetes bacterium]|nr:MFS transporter [Armatimonadota bacterium]